MQENNLSETGEGQPDVEKTSNDGQAVKRSRIAPKKKMPTVEVEGKTFERASKSFIEKNKKSGAGEKSVKTGRKVIERKSKDDRRSFAKDDRPGRSSGKSFEKPVKSLRKNTRNFDKDANSFKDSDRPFKSFDKSDVKSAKPFRKNTRSFDKSASSFKDNDRPYKKFDKSADRPEKPFRKNTRSFDKPANSFKDNDRAFRSSDKSTKRNDRPVKKAEGGVESRRKKTVASENTNERFSKKPYQSRKDSRRSEKEQDRSMETKRSLKTGLKSRTKKPVIEYGDGKENSAKKSQWWPSSKGRRRKQ